MHFAEKASRLAGLPEGRLAAHFPTCARPECRLEVVVEEAVAEVSGHPSESRFPSLGPGRAIPGTAPAKGVAQTLQL
jgi:hypothetical protein